jgi:hypothetical protein
VTNDIMIVVSLYMTITDDHNHVITSTSYYIEQHMTNIMISIKHDDG